MLSAWVFVTALLWGVTDPLLKYYGKESFESTNKKKKEEQDTDDNPLWSLASLLWGTLSEVASFFSNWRYALAFLANQAGSLTFVLALVNSDISLAVPVANGLKFVFSLVVGRRLGEGELGVRQQLGLALVLTGTVVHYLS